MRISDWSSDVCSSDLLAQQLRGIAADTFAGDLNQLDHALRIDDEGRAIGEALAIAQDIEIGRERVVLVAEHEEIDLADRGRAVMPRLVAEMRRSEEHTSELQTLMRISYAVCCLKKKKINQKSCSQKTEKKHNKNNTDIH